MTKPKLTHESAYSAAYTAAYGSCVEANYDEPPPPTYVYATLAAASAAGYVAGALAAYTDGWDGGYGDGQHCQRCETNVSPAFDEGYLAGYAAGQPTDPYTAEEIAEMNATDMSAPGRE